MRPIVSSPFHDYAADYASHRPTYPEALFDELARCAPGRGLAWDCATGNGQAALALASRFRRVIATDVSWLQLGEAAAAPGVEYVCASAEQPALRPDSADLVTVAQALHWFDHERFFAAVRRTLRPGGVLAAWCYELAEVDPAVDAVVGRLYVDVVGPYWKPARELLEQGYRTLDWPFEELAVPTTTMSVRWTLGAMLGYLSTWSAVHAYRREHGEDPLDLVRSDLERAWGAPGTERTVTWPLRIRAGRV